MASIKIEVITCKCPKCGGHNEASKQFEDGKVKVYQYDCECGYWDTEIVNKNMLTTK